MRAIRGAAARALGAGAALQAMLTVLSPRCEKHETSPHLTETPELKRLRELPSSESNAITRGLSALEFECFVCGTRVLTKNSLCRITVRPTPLRSSLLDSTDATKSALATGLFATTADVDGVSLGTARSKFKLPAGELPFPVFQRDVSCAKCGHYLGYRLEQEDGQPINVPKRPALKLWYQCGSARVAMSVPTDDQVNVGPDGFLHTAKCMGAGLRLVDESAYQELLKVLPPPDQRRRDSPPDSLERTARVAPSNTNGLDVFDVVKAELQRVRQAADRGVYLMRSVAADEADPHRTGLRARNVAAAISPAEHIDGERDSQYISASHDLSVVLLWALPYGLPHIIVERFALKKGATIVSHEHVRSSILASADDDEKAMQRLLPLAEMSAEALLRGDVHNGAVEEVNHGLRRVAVGPESHQGPGPAARVPVSFPATVLDWGQLRPVPIPDAAPIASSEGDKAVSAQRVTLFQKHADNQTNQSRSPRDYFARRGVVALAPKGSDEPAFLLIRMTPNALKDLPPPPPRGTPDLVQRQKERLTVALEAGGRQLRAAAQEATASGAVPPDCPVAYYELDYCLWQQREVFPSLQGYVVERVPVLLVPWGPGALAATKALCDRKSEGVPARTRQAQAQGAAQ